MVKSSYECLMRKLKGLDECRLKIGVIVALPVSFPIHKSKIMNAHGLAELFINPEQQFMLTTGKFLSLHLVIFLESG